MKKHQLCCIKQHSVYFENIYGANSDDCIQRVLAKVAPFIVCQLKEIDIDSQGYLREVRDTHVYPAD